MMKTKILITSLAVAILTTACNQQEFNTGQDKFEAYLKTKRVPLEDTARVERMRTEFERRTALANSIYGSGELDKALVDAEIEEFRKELLISRYFEQYLNDAVTDQSIQNYYGQNVDKYKTRKAKVAHILFRTNPRMSEEERQAVLTKAAEAYSRLNAGEEFAELAKELSEDKVSGEKGGDLGWINEGAVSGGFSARVFEMKAGETSEPFLTDFGYHIVRIDEEPQDVTKPLSALKGDIRYQLRLESKNAEIERLLDKAGFKPSTENQQ